MKRLNPELYRLYKKTERLHKLGIVRFSTYLKIRGMYHASIRPKPSKKLDRIGSVCYSTIS